MPNRNSIKILATILIIAFAMNGFSQMRKKSNTKLSNNWQVNYNLGFTEFYGDASNNGYFQKFSGEIAFATGLTVRKYFNPIFGLGFNLWYSGLKSHKTKSATGIPVNTYLTGNYFDGNVNLLIDFNNLFWGPSSRKFSVYGLIGLGYGSWNTQLTDSLSGLVINSGDAIGSITFKNGDFVIPIGVGLNYMLNENWAVNFEMNLRTVLNDDVDVWRDGFKYDQPLYTSFGVSYFFNGIAKPKNKSQRPQMKSVKQETLKPVVPIYNYRLQSTNKASGSSGSSDSGVLLIEPPTKKPEISYSGIVYRVQILAKRDNLPSLSSLKSKYNIDGEIYENYQDGIHRYSTGMFLTYQEAVQYSQVIKNNGVHDAFVVAYQNNIRIHITPEMKRK